MPTKQRHANQTALPSGRSGPFRKNPNYTCVGEKENTSTHPRPPKRGRSHAGLVSGRTQRNPTGSPAHQPTQPGRENICTNPRLPQDVRRNAGQVCVPQRPEQAHARGLNPGDASTSGWWPREMSSGPEGRTMWNLAPPPPTTVGDGGAQRRYTAPPSASG